MKTSEAGTKICPMMTNISPDGWNPAYCVGEACACWQTTARNRETKEIELPGNTQFIRSDIPKQELVDGWYYSAYRTVDEYPIALHVKKHIVTLMRYLGSLEGECGLTHPRSE